MARLPVTMWLGGILLLICYVQCFGDIVTVNYRLDNLDEDIIQLETGLLRVKEKVLHQIESAKTSLRLELKQHISEYVREAIAGILQGESIEEMVRSQVITEVRQLKRGNHVMRRQLKQVLMSVRDVREEMYTYKEALEKAKRDADELAMCSKYVVNSEILKRDLDKCNINNKECEQQTTQKDKYISEMKHKTEILNETYQLQLREISMSRVATKRVTLSSTPLQTTKTPVMTTAEPEEERSRVIIAPFESSSRLQFRQLNMHSNTVSTYQLRSLTYVASVAYVSKLRKLLIGLLNPDKIISSNLDSNDVKTVRHNVGTFGMAVDEEREIVFMTTSSPRYTISHMTTQGKDFTAITDLSSFGSVPLAIAVNSKKKKIYACNQGKMFVVTYDGRGLHTLATGSQIHAVTLDPSRSILYYNVGKNLTKMSLSNNVSEVMTTLSVTPWTIVYYRDTIYYSSYRDTNIGAFNVRYNPVSYKLQTMKDFYSYQAICLVP